MLPLVYTNPYAAGVFLAACLVWLAPEWLVAYRARAKVIRIDAGVRDRGSLQLLLGLQWTGLVLDFALAGLVPAAALSWQPALICGTGIGLILCGVVLRRYAIWALGHYFTREVAVSADQPVVQRGPYRCLRHPAYSGTFLTMLGIGCVLGNWAGLLLLLLGVFAGHLYRVHVEEQALLQSIGQPYAAYMRRTKRFIPWIV